MTGTRSSAPVRRVAVTLDAFDHSLAGLEQALRLARHMGAQLEGIFVEDLDLVQLAELPFLHEVRSASRSVEAMSPARMEQEMRVLARRAERLLSEQAARHNVTWTFRIWRGSIDSDLLAAAMEVDVLALTRLGAALVRPAAAHAGRSAVSVLFAGTESSARALDTAADIAAEQQAGLNVLLPAVSTANKAELERLATERMGDRAARAHFIAMPDASLTSLVETLAESDSAVLVLERGHALLQSPTLRQCLNTLDCPLLVVR